MFDMASSSIAMQRSSSSDSTTSTSSSSSSLLSLSPIGWNPSRSTISPPSITASPYGSTSSIAFLNMTTSRPVTPERRLAEPARLNLSSPRHAYAFPSWPIRESLSPSARKTSPVTMSCFLPEYIPSSRISDSDLEALDFSKRVVRATDMDDDEAVQGVSWSAIHGNPACDLIPALQVCDRKRRLPPPPAQYRRRNSSRKSPARKNQKSLVAIAE